MGGGPDRLPDLIAVFLAGWFFNGLVMQALGWRSEITGQAELREAFEASFGIDAEVRMDAAGFEVSGPGFSGRYGWLGGAVICEKWADHVVVLHQRMPLLIPARDAPDDLFERIIGWLEQAASRNDGPP